MYPSELRVSCQNIMFSSCVTVNSTPKNHRSPPKTFCLYKHPITKPGIRHSPNALSSIVLIRKEGDSSKYITLDNWRSSKRSIPREKLSRDMRYSCNSRGAFGGTLKLSFLYIILRRTVSSTVILLLSRLKFVCDNRIWENLSSSTWPWDYLFLKCLVSRYLSYALLVLASERHTISSEG